MKYRNGEKKIYSKEYETISSPGPSPDNYQIAQHEVLARRECFPLESRASNVSRKTRGDLRDGMRRCNRRSCDDGDQNRGKQKVA